MTLTIPEEVRAKAEIYVGDAAGQEKTRLLLQETLLPSGLLPLRDIIECGYVEETGFVWLRQKKKVDHYFAKAGRHVSYAAEVSAVAEKGRLKKITGVKAKEMLIWVTLHEICVDDPPTGKLVCKAIGGISRTFPVEAFMAPDQPPPLPAHVSKLAADEKKQVSSAAVDELPAKKETTPTADATAAAEEKVEKEKKEKEEEAAIGEVEEKMKEVAVQAEAVAAKN